MGGFGGQIRGFGLQGGRWRRIRGVIRELEGKGGRENLSSPSPPPAN